MKKIALVFLALIPLTFPALSDAEVDDVQTALRVAERWLAVVDAGDYEKSWDMASVLFQKAVPKETWVSQIESLKTPLGKPSKREAISQTRYQELPNAPKGDYVVVVFRSMYSNLKLMNETVVPMMEEGEWKVSGYYITP